jgi:hypothetical protein
LGFDLAERKKRDKMLQSPLCINSDYMDYYDKASSGNGIIYNRMLSESKQRGSALKYLRGLGLKTIEIRQVSQFSYLDGDLVVYTDPRKHNGQGKKIMTYGEAIASYSNFPASVYLKDNKGMTIKVLQVGKKRFSITFKKNEDEESLNPGIISAIQVMEDSYNMLVGLPIFSIDFIASGCEYVATDFNEVENLEKLYINNYLSEQDVCNEIIGALLKYNKAERK